MLYARSGEKGDGDLLVDLWTLCVCVRTRAHVHTCVCRVQFCFDCALDDCSLLLFNMYKNCLKLKCNVCMYFCKMHAILSNLNHPFHAGKKV